MVGLNQSFKKVFVAPEDNAIPTTATDTTADLTDGQIGIFDATTYAAVATPTAANNKGIIIAQGTPDQGGLPGGAGIRNESDKLAKIIQSGKITKWEAKLANAGQSRIIVIGNLGDGTNTDTISGKCDEIKNIYLDLSGAPIKNLVPGTSLIRHYAVEGPCCDSCGDNCAEVADGYFRDEFYNLMTQDTLPGGQKLTDYVKITKIDQTIAGTDYYGLQFESAFVDHETSECYFDIFPYNAEPVIINASTYDPDWHDGPCTNEYAVTVTQELVLPNGDGEYVIRLEEKSKMWDYRYYPRDPALRLATGTKLYTDPTATYDEYILRFNFDYKVGGWSDTYVDSYEVHVFFQSGHGKDFVTAINGYTTLDALDVPANN